MAEFQRHSISFSSVSSDESRDSIEGGDAENYEEIEAPKFVDFKSLDRYRPDDRYWFCLRVGCDQKHDKEMDSEAIHKKFVLRVMAARSPCMKLQKALEKKTPLKRPLSAPPKSCKPTFSSMAKISSVAKKLGYEKEEEIIPALKPNSTPTNKVKPVAAKYLSTPRNKNVPSSFRSVQPPKLTSTEVPRSRVLFLQSPKNVEIASSDKQAAGHSGGKPCKKFCINSSVKELNSSKVQKNAISCQLNTPTGNDGLILDGDDKENATASEANRHMATDLQQTFGTPDKGGHTEKVVKLKKQKTTNPKPFRLRTDERKLLKDATSSERKANETSISTPKAWGGTNIFSPMKQGHEIRKEIIKPPTTATETNKLQEYKHTNSPQPSKAMQRLEKFKKTSSPLERQKNIRLVSPQKMTSYLIPGQKLDTIHENTPQVWETNKLEKPTRENQLQSCRRQGITVPREPNFHKTHLPRSCIKNSNN